MRNYTYGTPHGGMKRKLSVNTHEEALAHAESDMARYMKPGHTGQWVDREGGHSYGVVDKNGRLYQFAHLRFVDED